MTAKEFWIDQSDPAYPEIRHRSHPDFDPDYEGVHTHEGARRQIKELCREHRNHWLAVRRYQLNRSAEDIIREAE